MSDPYREGQPEGPFAAPLASAQPPYPPRRQRSSQPTSPVTQAAITMMMLAVTLASARFVVPTIIEESRYAWRRGQLRADYETSEVGLRDSGLDALAVAYQMVTQRVGASVVHIDVTRHLTTPESGMTVILNGQDRSSDINDQGSGVIVDAAGYVLTNHHVVADGDRIVVGLSDGRRVDASVVGTDPLTDLALLRIEASDLLAIQWGDSDQCEVGSPVWAVGSPFGLDHTVTFGILSGKHRAAKAGTSYQDFMQSDVAVNPGNSGGPLVDGQGRLIGINTAIVGDTYRGVSFSIPSNVARRVSENLKKGGRFDRGWLGVELVEAPEQVDRGATRPTHGAMISRLADPQSPAALAGLASGDIIVRFEGDEVADRGALMRMVGNWPAGRPATLDVLRDGERQTIVVEIGMRPEPFNVR